MYYKIKLAVQKWLEVLGKTMMFTVRDTVNAFRVRMWTIKIMCFLCWYLTFVNSVRYLQTYSTCRCINIALYTGNVRISVCSNDTHSKLCAIMTGLQPHVYNLSLHSEAFHWRFPKDLRIWDFMYEMAIHTNWYTSFSQTFHFFYKVLPRSKL